jgi:hypothetical protein
MPLRKTAIALPEDLIAAVDRAAKQRRETRNRFVTRVLERAVRAGRDADITRELNDLFADRKLSEAQRKEGARLDASGTSWEDERW